MNVLKGEITEVEVYGNLSLVHLLVGGSSLSSIVIETPETVKYLIKGNLINVLFKETEVIIGKDLEHHISLQNQLLCSISHIEEGVLLSKLTLKHAAGEIASVITTNAVKQLHLKPGEQVMAMIKTNEVMLSE